LEEILLNHLPTNFPVIFVIENFNHAPGRFSPTAPFGAPGQAQNPANDLVALWQPFMANLRWSKNNEL